MMYVGAGTVTFDTGECSSLKEKRSIARSLIDKARSKFENSAVSEVGKADNFRRLTIGVSVISNDKTVTENMLTKLMTYLEENSFRTALEYHVEIFAL